ncbi:endonuclease dU [Billgrantia sp. C5P2]|uniref:endonuclease dU n=1 Tax=Billgrantia sp. C5P2 TaxID=3436239 RepID=UPI003DA5F2DA
MATTRRERTFSHIVGFDDCPFPRGHRGDVAIVGAVFSGLRLEGVLSGKVRRDGVNSTRELIRLAGGTRFAAHLQLVMLQGVALAGFNVVDAVRLHAELGLPVLVVARRAPRKDAMRRALLERIPGGARKWALVERLGEMELLAGVYVQRVGLSRVEAEHVLRATTPHGSVPEPLRVAHLIAGGVTTGESSGRV